MLGQEVLLATSNLKIVYLEQVTFDSAGLWGFDVDFATNAIIFGADNSSSSHSDNRKNNFLISGEGATYSIKIKALDRQKKSLVLILLKQIQNF